MTSGLRKLPAPLSPHDRLYTQMETKPPFPYAAMSDILSQPGGHHQHSTCIWLYLWLNCLINITITLDCVLMWGLAL